MGLVFASLVVAAVAALALVRHVRGDLARVRYLTAARNEPALATGHLSLRWRNLVDDARILRITLEGVVQTVAEEMVGLSADVRGLLMQAHYDTGRWVAHYLAVIEAEPVEELALRQRVETLRALSARWSVQDRESEPKARQVSESLCQAVEILTHFEREVAFVATPYR